jgi:hypothetical protein
MDNAGKYAETAHIGWAVDALESWAHTFIGCEMEDEGDDVQESDGYEIVMGLAERLQNGTATVEDHHDILFHLWQAKGQEDEG